MYDVGGDDKIVIMTLEALSHRVLRDVQNLVFECIVFESLFSSTEEPGRDVRISVTGP